MKAQELTIDSEVFKDTKFIFDDAISHLLRNMIRKDLSEGKLTLTVKITSANIINQETGASEQRMIFEPKINIKIGEKADAKCPITGGLLAEIDKNGNVLVGSNQIDIDELMNEMREGA